MLQITFLSVGCADGIHIRYYGTDNSWHNIVIDGGRNTTYNTKVKPILNEIARLKENVDIWIITHIDDDHIGALLYAINNDINTLETVNFCNTKVLYNYNVDDDYQINISNSELKSVKQGVSLAKHLIDNKVSVINNITNSSETIEHYGAKIIFTSPSKEYYESFISKWRSLELKRLKKADIEYKAAHQSDYNTPYSNLILESFKEDSSVWNKSSIAFILEFAGHHFMFSADASPLSIYNSLQKMGYSENNKLKLEFMQLPHHGSKHNISNELLSIVECNNYIISANGLNKHNLPNKEAISRVIYQNKHKPIKIYLTANKEEMRNMFIDDKAEEVHKTEFIFSNTNIKISLQNG